MGEDRKEVGAFSGLRGFGWRGDLSLYECGHPFGNIIISPFYDRIFIQNPVFTVFYKKLFKTAFIDTPPINLI